MYETTTDDCNADARLRSTMQLVVVVLCMFPLSMIKSMDSLKVRNSITPAQTAPRPLHYHHLLHVLCIPC